MDKIILYFKIYVWEIFSLLITAACVWSNWYDGFECTRWFLYVFESAVLGIYAAVAYSNRRYWRKLPVLFGIEFAVLYVSFVWGYETAHNFMPQLLFFFLTAFAYFFSLYTGMVGRK